MEGTKNGKNILAVIIISVLIISIVLSIIVIVKRNGDDNDEREVSSSSDITVSDNISASSTEKSTSESTTLPSVSMDNEQTTSETAPSSIYDGIIYRSKRAKVTDIKKYGKDLMLLNNDYRLPDNFKWDLVYWSNGGTISEGTRYSKRNQTLLAVDRSAYKPLKDMFAAAARDGVPLELVSAYRSLQLQDKLFGNAVKSYMAQGLSKEEAIKKENIERTFPGSSEHHTGLCVDISVKGSYVLSQGFENTPQFKWLSENAEKYGFILRYRKDKTSITEIMYEPWHYRYVGVEHAEKINSLDMCLEEYIKYLDAENNK